MTQETWVQSQVESYQRLRKWYLMPPFLTLSIIRYGSRVKWSNPGKGITPSPTPWCSHHHHHHVVPPAQISLTLSRHFSLSFMASGRSSGLHPVSSQRCCMYVWAGRPAFVRSYVGVHRSTSLMSSSLLLQLCPACLVRLTIEKGTLGLPSTTVANNNYNEYFVTLIIHINHPLSQLNPK